MTDLFDEIPDQGPAPDWMHILIQVPLDTGNDILHYLRIVHRFDDVDWCVMGREEDNSRADFAPCAPLTQKPLG